MKKTIAGAGIALLTSTMLLAGCSNDSSDDAATSGATTTATSTDASTDGTSAAATPSGDVEVVSQTNLTLDAANGTFDLLGLKTKVVDTDGKDVTVGDDANTWLVVKQDPETGTVPAGSVVTLTVKKAS
ncbi:PASTA domain-containing protein [Cellulomonas sp. HZM]|uniref:PASTA domain-containing protein n=1 Tax=Cellulomonas sp. HZM TaxID=1454010 RepID=UPI000492FEF1|nr:PASTA domain-containing protein [Cellulomonas sp. HZM]